VRRFKFTIRIIAVALSVVFSLAGAAPATVGCGSDCACDHSTEKHAACRPDFPGLQRPSDRMAHGYAAFLEQRGYARTLSVHQLNATCVETISVAYCEYHQFPLMQAFSGSTTTPNRLGRLFAPALSGGPDHGFGEYSYFSGAARTYFPNENAPAIPLYLRHLSLLF